MRKIIILGILFGLSASLSHAGSKCEEAKTFLSTKKSEIEAVTAKNHDHDTDTKTPRGRRHGKVRIDTLKRNVAALTKETEKASGQSEKKCERLMKNIERRLNKAK